MKTKNAYQLKAVRFFAFTLLSLVLLVGVKYSLDKSNIRNIVLETIRAGIAPESLIEFEFTVEVSSNLNWKKDHEFELNGEMYDIVSTVETENGVLYQCFHDTKESKYKRQFYKWIGNWLLPEEGSSNENKKNKNVFKTYYCQAVAAINMEGEVTKQSQFYKVYQNNYYSLVIEPNSPPPKF